MRLVDTNGDKIMNKAKRLLDNPVVYHDIARALSPYGEGRAAERIVSQIIQKS